MIFAVTIITSCSKDDQLVPQQANSSDKMIKTPPIYTGGYITGKFVPAPDICLITVSNNEGFSKEYVPGIDGSFKITGVPQGIYDLMVSYSFVQEGEQTKTYYLEILRVSVIEDQATELGLINLPVILR